MSVHAVVARGGYVFRGQSLPKNTVVKMPAATFKETQRVQPSYFREASDAEVKKAGTIIDLFAVKGATASNTAAAEAALAADAPSGGKK